MKLKLIVDSINTTIKSNLNQERFQKGVYYGLSKSVLIKDENSEGNNRLIPMIYVNGEKRVSVDDSFPLNLYHRCISLSQVIAPIQVQFGDGYDTIVETAIMAAIVFGDSEIINLCQEDLASIITSAFPSTMTISDISKVIVRTTTVNNDSFSVYNQEYKSTEYPLNPEDYYFSINYTVETTFDKSCVDKCCN